MPSRDEVALNVNWSEMPILTFLQTSFRDYDVMHGMERMAERAAGRAEGRAEAEHEAREAREMEHCREHMRDGHDGPSSEFVSDSPCGLEEEMASVLTRHSTSTMGGIAIASAKELIDFRRSI
jgi:hypothetical protein